MYLEDMSLNTGLTTEKVEITKEDMVAFAKKYDPFLLHWNEDYAKTTRYGQLVAPGVMTFMSIWARVIESNFFGNELIAGKSTKIEWFQPVFAGDVLYGKGKITKLTRRNCYNGVVELTLWVYNQNEELVLIDKTEFVVMCRSAGEPEENET